MPEKSSLASTYDKEMAKYPHSSSESGLDLERPHSIRRDSEDSGVDNPVFLNRRSHPGISRTISMKRSGSDSVQRPMSGDGNMFSISEQTQLLLRKMLVLEKKVQSMEKQLKEEQLQRLHLEAKVVKLEEENDELKVNRGVASKQLQAFADTFYASTEGIRLGSLSPSPHPSLVELRTPSRRDSASSAGSLYSRDSVCSRYSTISTNSQC